jgi:hypothetical protein
VIQFWFEFSLVLSLNFLRFYFHKNIISLIKKYLMNRFINQFYDQIICNKSKYELIFDFILKSIYILIEFN